MSNNVAYCYCGLSVIVLSYWFLLTRKDMRRRNGRLFLYVLIMETLSCVFNLFCGIIDSDPLHYSIFAREIVHGVYLITHSMVAPFMAWYFITFTGVSHKLNKIWKTLFVIPFVVMIILPVLIPAVRAQIYSFDGNGVYTRGPLAFWTVSLGGIVYAAIIVATAIRNWDRFNREQKGAIFFLLIFFSLPTMIEVNLLEHQQISPFFEALGVFLVLLSVDNQNWVYHMVTHTYNRLTAQRHMQNEFKNKVAFQIVVISLCRSTYSRLALRGSEELQGVLSMAGAFFSGLKMDTYYCELGSFMIPVYQDSEMDTDALKKTIASRFDDKWQIGNREFFLPVRVVTVGVPDDTDSVEKLFEIIDQPYEAEAESTTFLDGKILLSFIEHLKDDDRPGDCTECSGRAQIPEELLVMLDSFNNSICKLTATERKVVSYYLDGYDIASIPELMGISINTVRKHNRSIYQKLNIGSREELMIYLDVLERCGMLDPVEQVLSEGDEES